MNCLAVGDILVTKAHFDEALENCGVFEKYHSISWMENISRSEFRNVIRRLETNGHRAFEVDQELFKLVEDVEVLFIHQHPVPGQLIKAAKKLKFILSARGGVENIDMPAARLQKINVINCPAHNAIAVAEYTIGLMLCELRNIVRSHTALMRGEWREKYPNSEHIGELSDAVIGIIGFGTIGQLVAERLQSFGCKVLVFDPLLDFEKAKLLSCTPATFDEILVKADILSLHCRLPGNSPPLIGEAELIKVKSNAYLINTARSALVDLEALYRALKDGRLRGAALDVFPQEPVSKEFPLLELDNVTLTNHRGGDTYNAYAKAPELLLNQLKEFLDKGETRFIVR